MIDLTVRKNPESSRYEAHIGGQLAGFATYVERPGGVVELPHTVVETEFEGKGVASALAEFAFKDIGLGGGKVLPTCPFMAGWVGKHPEYLTMVAPGR